MKILVHDYPGHAFPVHLSRALARAGHDVTHVWFAAFQSPKGALARRPDDPPGFTLAPLDLGEPFQKYSFLKRRGQERAFGRKLCALADQLRPDVILSGNAPLDPQAMLQDWARARAVPYVFWLQDLYSLAIDKILRRKIPVLGHVIGAWYIALERRTLRRADAIVSITEDFNPTLSAWGIDLARVMVQENWAALDELPPQPRHNAWSAAHGLDDKLVFLYSGTLGLKHNPSLLADLARHFRARPEVRVVVISEGLGADWLTGEKAKGGLDNLLVLPFQPYADLPCSVATGDCLVVILEPDAGVFSVPSKILTYFCAGRPVLGAIPTANLAARVIAREGIGETAPPEDLAGFLGAADRMIGDAARRAEQGRHARAYAEHAFDIDQISCRFLRLLTGLRGK